MIFEGGVAFLLLIIFVDVSGRSSVSETCKNIHRVQIYFENIRSRDDG